MTEQEKSQHRCCFTGHRPEKLSCSEAEVKSWLEKVIRQAIADGFITFISGMARGVNIWAAEIVLRLRDEGRPIHLVCARPIRGLREELVGRLEAAIQRGFMPGRHCEVCLQRI